MASIIDAQGATQQIEVTLDNLIRPAKDSNMSVREYANATFPTNAEKYGDAFSQLCASEGIILKSSKAYGLKAPSLSAVLDGRPTMEAGAIVRQPSSQARILLMPAIGALTEDKLVADLDMNAEQFDRMIAVDTVIADEWYLWPEANYAGPEAGRSQIVSQLAKPTTMLTLTTSEKNVRVPTYALSVEWSEQATKYLNLDFVSLSIARQIAVERNERANQNLLAMLNGDADAGMASLASLGKVKTAVSLDAAATTGLTQLSVMKWFYSSSRKRRIDWIVTDIDGAIAYQNRTGRPIITQDNNTSPRINTEMVIANPTWGDNVNVFITDDPAWPAKTLMGIDSRFAIQRVTSTNASYEAIENFALRRGSAMRWDYGTMSRRIMPDAFDVLTYA